MTLRANTSPHKWDGAAEMMPLSVTHGHGPEGAFLPDVARKADQIAVVYDSDETPPAISIWHVSQSVCAVMANGVAVAVVACANGPSLKAEDVVLVARSV
ncbi:MAG: hypothetical protein WBC93_18445 [Sulfitobacter sp.]